MRSSWRPALLYFLLSVLAGLAMVTSESLWIDEGQTWHFARQPTFLDWFAALRDNLRSEAQMPLGMLVAWCGGQLLGLGEWQMRAVNVLWVGLAGTVLGLVGRQLKQPAVWLVFLLHPFVWFYANEARPYALQICASTGLVYVLARLHATATLDAGDLWVLAAAVILGYGASLLFAFGILGFLAGAAVLWWRGRFRFNLTLRHWWPLLVALAMLVTMTAYYLYTLKRGAAGAKIWQVTPLNLAFAMYETLGFSGWGPPRNELRDLARSPSQLLHHLLQARFALGLGLGALLYAFMLIRLWRRRGEPLVQGLSAFVLVTCLSLYVAAAIVGFPFWGRHLAPIVPVVILLSAHAVQAAPSPLGSNASGFARRYALLLALLACLLGSSLKLRFGAEYRKDDYRSASLLARQALASGRVVWWSADPQECAAYYGLSALTNARLVFCYQPTTEKITGWPSPDLIFQSKPDIHDPQGQLQSFIDRSQFHVLRRLPAFVIWTKKETGAQTPANRE